MSDVDQHAEAHRLKVQHGWGARRIAERLGITRYRAKQLLARPVAERVVEVAERVAEVVEPVADRPAALVSHRPAGGRRLVLDLDQHPGLAEDLAELQRTSGATSPAEVIDWAVDRLATAARTARARGLLREREPFDVVRMWLKPTVRRRTAA
ncbi:hypothetical protein [Streptomyces sp. NPDC006997]|uniref:hypothetical protein n=1 Tax=Streptomyces sp. NPDC006997 TaxID=3155356 RepID=UPI0033EB8D69